MPVIDFKVVLDPDPQGGYVVTCPSLPGCYSQGRGVAGALANIRQAIGLSTEDARKHGERL
jgi:antitoxin HicB